MKHDRTTHMIARVREADPFEARFHLEIVERRQLGLMNGRATPITGGVFHPHSGIFEGQNGIRYRIGADRHATRVTD